MIISSIMTVKRKLRLVIFLFILILSCNSGRKEKEKIAVSKNLIHKNSIGYENIDSLFLENFLNKYPEYRTYRSKLHKFYNDRSYKLAWTEKGVPIPQTEMFINLIHNLRSEGLKQSAPFDYHLRDTLNTLKDSLPPSEMARIRKELDMAITSGFFHFAPILWKGSIKPEEAGINWYISKRNLQYTALLDSILTDKETSKPFIDYSPLHPEYFNLKSALKKYREIEKNGGWPYLNQEKKLLLGDSGREVLALSRRLILTGDLDSQHTHSVFNPNVKKGVEAFQRRHGLMIDGIVGGNTLEALNTPVEEKIRQIIVNMERWRWIPGSLSNKYVFVNIPAYKLFVYENDKVIKTMNVIVGKTANQTPVFNDEIKYVVINPYWNIPTSITTKEILPQLKKDSTYLKRHEMEVGLDWNFKTILNADTINWSKISPTDFPYKLRQKPGPNNPLGRIKFLFPNQFAVYLHDTPKSELFSQRERGFSHGCIRVEEPFELGAYLLKANKNWSKRKILKTVESEIRDWITLNEQIPVYIVYLTTWVDEKNNVHFRKDNYGHDKKLEEYLF